MPIDAPPPSIQPTYPDRATISNNHMHEIGIYGKQTSCYFQVRTSRNGTTPPLSALI
jgi:hypothetical protein